MSYCDCLRCNTPSHGAGAGGSGFCKFEALSNKIDKLLHYGEKIMTAISDFATQVEQFQTQISTALDDVKTEIQTLNDTITQLQNSGSISADDQASLDKISASAQALSQKVEALDTINPPTAPTGSGTDGTGTGSTGTGSTGSDGSSTPPTV